MMTKTDLYNHALSLLDLRLETIADNSKERHLIDLNYPKVVQFVLKAWEFPYLIKKVKLTEADIVEDQWKFLYGYTLPADFGRVVQIEGSKDVAFSVRFGVLWTDYAEPLLEYMPKDLEVDIDGNYTAPSDFMALVAYQLALHVAPFLDPESQAMGTAAQLYQLTLQSIIESETHSNDREPRYGADKLWGDEDAFDLIEYRRMLFEESR